MEKLNKFGDGICYSLYLIINVSLPLFKYLIIFYTQISTICPPTGGYNEWLDNISNVKVLMKKTQNTLPELFANKENY